MVNAEQQNDQVPQNHIVTQQFDHGFQFRSVAEMIMHLALRAIAADDSMKCYCGSPPYLDGESCPKCFCAEVLEEVKPLLSR